MAQRALTRVPVFPLTRAAPRGEGLFFRLSRYKDLNGEWGAGKQINRPFLVVVGFATGSLRTFPLWFWVWRPDKPPAVHSPHARMIDSPVTTFFILTTDERKVNRFWRGRGNFKEFLILPNLGWICLFFLMLAALPCASPKIAGDFGGGWSDAGLKIVGEAVGEMSRFARHDINRFTSPRGRWGGGGGDVSLRSE
ncbi:MAG: hypothetical protein KatS3mg045_1514 [Bellilinea sp.]|nr:MAG: hypothetical protein KatS3mg045_1514 [Bellilinea sp.]